jgi:hypothetical protein
MTTPESVGPASSHVQTHQTHQTDRQPRARRVTA